MKVIKKDGRVQEFVKNKIRVSIANVASDADIILNESDLDILANETTEILNKLTNDRYTSSYEILGILFGVLQKNRFGKVFQEMIEHNIEE